MTFDDFIRAEMAGLVRFAGALTGDDHHAEDMLSDALLAVSTRWYRISRMDHPLAYVRRAVVNAFLSDRRKARRRATDSTADLAVLDRPDDDPHRVIEDRDVVRRLLASLTPQQRTAVVLRYLLDQSDPEIAEVMGCTSATVRSHLSHARAALRLVASPRGTRLRS